MSARVRPFLIVLLAVSCLVGGYGLGMRSATISAPPMANLSAEDQQAFRVVWETLAQIESDYYRRNELDRQKLADGAARGLVEAVGDPYTRLLDPARAERARSELRGRFDGIGAQLAVRDGQVRVVAPLRGSPAEQAGLRAGDVIAAIDHVDASHLALGEAVRKLRGQAGTSVLLSVRRGGSVDPLVLTITRAEVRVPSVEGRLLDGDSASLGYVRISMFAEPTAQQLHDQLAVLLAEGARGIVLDVRSNPGGYLSSAVDVTSAFVRDGVVLYQQRGPDASERKTYRANGSAQAPDVPLVVLVDAGSASAAEIVAAALRDNQRALLVGQKTFGKGTVQEQHPLSDASQLRVTVAQWLTPSGRAIQGQGLLPDVEVTPVDDRDAILEAGVDVLSRAVGRG
ncbi:MAG TPA: S41 family peptidase [Chloroflexota bacterium]